MGTNGNGLFPSLDNVIFQNISRHIAAVRLRIFGDDQPAASRLHFQLTTPSGAGSYINIVGPDTLTMSSISPASSGGFVNLSGNGAVIGWPNTDDMARCHVDGWARPATGTGGVPTAASDVVIDAAANSSPRLAPTVTVHNLTVNTGAICPSRRRQLSVNGSITVVAAGARSTSPALRHRRRSATSPTDTTSTTGITSCTGGQAINLQSGTHNITGKFCNLFSIFGTTLQPARFKSSDPGSRVAQLQGTGGNLIFNGHRVDVTQYSAVGGSGLITMTNTLDSLCLHGGSTRQRISTAAQKPG